MLIPFCDNKVSRYFVLITVLFTFFIHSLDSKLLNEFDNLDINTSAISEHVDQRGYHINHSTGYILKEKSSSAKMS